MGLKAKSFKLYKIRFDVISQESKEGDIEAIKNKLIEYGKMNTPLTPYLLIIDGDSLDVVLHNHESLFLVYQKTRLRLFVVVVPDTKKNHSKNYKKLH